MQLQRYLLLTLLFLSSALPLAPQLYATELEGQEPFVIQVNTNGHQMQRCPTADPGGILLNLAPICLEYAQFNRSATELYNDLAKYSGTGFAYTTKYGNEARLSPAQLYAILRSCQNQPELLFELDRCGEVTHILGRHVKFILRAFATSA